MEFVSVYFCVRGWIRVSWNCVACKYKGEFWLLYSFVMIGLLLR